MFAQQIFQFATIMKSHKNYNHGKLDTSLQFYCILFLLYATEVNSDCIRVEDEDYRIYQQRRHYYNQYSYDEKPVQKDRFECHSVDLSYITWILPPSSYTLVELTCIGCKFDTLPGKLDSYTALTHMKIINSTIQNITNDMFLLDRLEELVIIGSNVSYIENSSFNLDSLKELNLRHNLIKNIYLANSKITSLDLSYNILQNVSFPKTLQKLYLENSRLVIQKDTFVGLHDLLSLDISGNNISVLPHNLFGDLISLNFLNISYNNLTSLDYGSFSGLHQLARLDISHNLLTDIPEYVLHDIGHVIQLYIHNNNISDFDAKVMIANMPNIQQIAMSDNPWNCDMLSLSIRAIKSKNILLVPGNCKTTPNILKICCIKNEYSSIVSKDPETPTDTLQSINNFYNRDFENSKFYKFFTKDYKQQNFWKFFDADYKQSSLFKFFDTGFLGTQFYRYFNRDYFNATFQNKIINKIENISQEETNFNVTELKDSLKDLFREFFYTLNSSNPIETLPKNDQLTQCSSHYNNVLVAVLITLVILLSLYIIFSKFNYNDMVNKLKFYRTFKSTSTSVNEPEMEIL